MKFNYLHPREQLVAIMKRIYQNGMTTLSGGNLSIFDEGNIWITPAGIDKGTLGPEDIILVGTDGVSMGPHKPSSEYPFHRAIYRKRPDIRAIVHAHPPALVAFSIAREIPDTRIIPQANRVCGLVGYAPYALPGSPQLGEQIAATFSEGYDVVLLENHGVAAGGPDLLGAFQRLETLDFCARTLINAKGLGDITYISDDQMESIDRRIYRLPEFDAGDPSSRERELRRQVVEVVHRAYDRYLMISTEGVVSARMAADTFLITPTGMDRRSIDRQDLVLIDSGRREAGKMPSRSVNLHRAIYARHPALNCIITAQSPHIVAFAVSKVEFDTRTIPESYILLRDVPLVSFLMIYQSPDVIAEKISERSPVLLIENDCVLTTGESIIQAFDRLEVAEYSAKALLDSRLIGNMVPIGNAEIQELVGKFLSD